MRIPYVAEVLLAGISLSPLPLVAAEPQIAGGAANTAIEPKSAATRRIQAIQDRLNEQVRILKQRLAEAQRTRETALQKNDLQMLKKAEQLERQAFADYQQQVQQTEQAPMTTPARRPSVKRLKKRSPSAHRRPQPEPRSRSPRLPFLWPFGGR